MAATVLADTGFLVALLRRRDVHREWAASQVAKLPPPWHTCEAVLSEAFFLLGEAGVAGLSALIRRGLVVVSFGLASSREPVLGLMRKYSNVPMSFADACLVRMTELLADPVLVTVDADFRIYRRNGRQVVPCVMPA